MAEFNWSDYRFDKYGNRRSYEELKQMEIEFNEKQKKQKMKVMKVELR